MALFSAPAIFMPGDTDSFFIATNLSGQLTNIDNLLRAARLMKE
jgi:hypothetical protein